MLTSVHSLQSVHVHAADPSNPFKPPKNLQTEAPTQTAIPADTVAISQQARQALATTPEGRET